MIKLTSTQNKVCFIEPKAILALTIEPLTTLLECTCIHLNGDKIYVLEDPKEIMLATTLSRKEIQDLK